METIQALLPLLQTPNKIVITTHQNPDADALGSSLGLFHYLKQKGHSVKIISSTYYPNFLNWLPSSNEIIIYEKDESIVKNILADSEILFCLDFNIYTRTATLADTLKDYQGIKVIIDHHLSPDENYFNFGESNPEKSSTCEMIYDFIIQDKGEKYFNKNIAESLYAGVMTDTGNFRYSCTSPSTHRMIATMMEFGAVPNTIAENIYDTYEEKRLRLLGHIFSNRLQVFTDKKAALIYLDKQDMQTFNVGQGETEGIVNYPLSINGINFSTFMSVKENEIRMSFRSKGDMDVNQFARKYFNGGGHKNAAGGKSVLSLDDTLTAFQKALIEFTNY